MPLSLPQAGFAVLTGASYPLAEVQFSGAFTLGSAIVGILVIIVAGLFTIRTNVAKIWKDNAEAEAAARKLAEKEAKEQRELKHALISEHAAEKLLWANEKGELSARITLLETRPDMSAISEQISAASAESVATIVNIIAAHDERVAEMYAKMIETNAEIAKVLKEIQKSLQKNNG